MRVASFYRFTDIEDPEKLKRRLQVLCDKAALLGTVLVAPEGVNGTLAGPTAAVQSVLDWLAQFLSLEQSIEGRWSDVDDAPFRRMRVKTRKEIVTLGRPDIRPDKRAGKHVGVDEWNALISDPDTLVIDTRNDYEFEVGTFRNAVDPGTQNFREFPPFAEKLSDTDKNKRLAMFCTGGIRCEKATALMLELGFRDVYHLQGGILKYLEEVDDDKNLWQGECFVFDTRVAIDRELAQGDYVQCHACRRPLSREDIKSAAYREGVSCPKCASTIGDSRTARLEERRKQVALAKERGEDHIGARLEN